MCAFLLTEFRPESGEPAIAQVELPPVEMTFVGVDDVRAFETFWHHMTEATLSPEESAKFIAGLLQT
jgi:hypothetical protein